MKRISFAGLLISTALALACDSAPPPQPVTTPTMATAKTNTGPNERAIESVLAAAIPQHNGGSFKLSELNGKVVIVDFWGTWCPPCRKQAPQLAALSKKYREKGLAVVGLTLDKKEDEKLVSDFIKATGMNYPVGYPNRVISDAFLNGTEDDTGAPPIPQLFIFGRDGRLVEHLVGNDPEHSLPRLEQVITQQLSLNPASR